jgi:hypothetical protein
VGQNGSATVEAPGRARHAHLSLDSWMRLADPQDDFGRLRRRTHGTVVGVSARARLARHLGAGYVHANVRLLGLHGVVAEVAERDRKVDAKGGNQRIQLAGRAP